MLWLKNPIGRVSRRTRYGLLARRGAGGELPGHPPAFHGSLTHHHHHHHHHHPRLIGVWGRVLLLKIICVGSWGRKAQSQKSMNENLFASAIDGSKHGNVPYQNGAQYSVHRVGLTLTGGHNICSVWSGSYKSPQTEPVTTGGLSVFQAAKRVAHIIPFCKEQFTTPSMGFSGERNKRPSKATEEGSLNGGPIRTIIPIGVMGDGVCSLGFASCKYSELNVWTFTSQFLKKNNAIHDAGWERDVLGTLWMGAVFTGFVLCWPLRPTPFGTRPRILAQSSCTTMSWPWPRLTRGPTGAKSMRWAAPTGLR